VSNQINTARVQGFKRGIDILSQQKGSKLQRGVRVEMQSSKQEHYDQIGATQAVLRTARHSDTPLVNTPHSRRAVTLADYEWADLIDKQDKLRILNDPTNAYSMNAAYAMGRVKDQIILEALTGTALAGETGAAADSVAYDTGNDVGSAAVESRMTYQMLLEAKAILDDNEVDEDVPRFIAVTADELNGLLQDTEVQSADYNTVKALVKGEINTFCGFNFIRVNSSFLPLTTSGDTDNRACPFWSQNSIVLAIGEGLSGSTARIDERPDKGYATQVYYAGSYGAVRLEEAGVGRIWADVDNT
jgi:hypothetical protein